MFIIYAVFEPRYSFENLIVIITPMFKHIIFDWSGVINDCILNFHETANRMFKELGHEEISLEEIKENWEQPFMNFYNKFFPNLTLEEEKIAYKKSVIHSPPNKPYPGIVRLIRTFKEMGIGMAVLSSDLPQTILKEIKDFGMEGLFEEVLVDVHDKGEAIHDLIKRNNFNKKETIFIGDSNHEIEVGKNVGINTGAVTWGFSTEDRLRAVNPDFIIHNLKELEGIILNKGQFENFSGSST